MIGLMILGALAVYLLVSVFVTSKVANWAKANNKKPWLWGGLAAFVMYNLVFWDWIPTLIMHKHYCDTQAGFWAYKTPEQWMKENPKMRALEYKEKNSDDFLMERTSDGGNKTSFSTRTTSNIKYTETLNPIFFVIKNRRLEETLFDKKQKSALVKRITFMAGRSSGAPKDWSNYRFWVNFTECDGENGNANKANWQTAFNEFMKLGE